MKRGVWQRLACVALIAPALGCATIWRGTTQTVFVDSDPPGATIRHTASGETWQTPADIELKRRSRHVLAATLDGYETQEIYVRSEASILWWYVDIITLGIGNAIDAITGGLFDLKPERVRVVFERPDSSGADPVR